MDHAEIVQCRATMEVAGLATFRENPEKIYSFRSFLAVRFY
jgi:hypothetical protein